MTMIYDWARRKATQSPDRTAITLNNNHLTFGELESQSNRLAGMLIHAGLKPKERVGLLLEKTPQTIIAMHGISKAGGIYVPLDIHSPANRVQKILDSSHVSMLMTDHHAQSLFEELNETNTVAPWIWWSQQQIPEIKSDRMLFQYSDLESEPDKPYTEVRSEDSIAHILFTSGSTGDPKGVIITHKNVSAFINWATNYFSMNADDRVSGHAPLHFDLSTFDIYGSLSVGAHLFMVPPSMSIMPNELTNFILENRLTQWFSVPSALSYLAQFKAIPEGGFPDLKRLIWCGEVFPVESLRYWMRELPEVQFTNLYGPTEATIASSYHTLSEIPEKGGDVPIGTACKNEKLMILDENMSEVEDGEMGDLYISGVGLSPGYWRDPEKMEAAFKVKENGDGHLRRIYKTGDLATFKNGLFYYHGRADHQIKSRGYRIELGEIESALDELNLLREFAVIPVEKGGFEGTAIGCAYVQRNSNEITPADLKDDLLDIIPSYMIPQFWETYDKLPRNVNGKIDRKSLSEQFENPDSATAQKAVQAQPN